MYSFPIWNQSVSPHLVLTVASLSAYRFLWKQVWFPQTVVIKTVKGFSVVNKAEVDVFMEFPCFLHDPMNVGNLISGSSASLKPSLYIWKFLVHVLLKPSLTDFEHYLLECEMSVIVW